MSVFMRAHAIAGPWPARGRLVVCVDATAASEHVIRTAKRLADQRHLPWTAIYVQTLGSATSARAQLDGNLALASQLGADTAILTGDRVGEVIVEYSRTHNAAQVVVGRSMDVRHRFWPRRRLAQWLLDHATDFEITIVAAPTNGSGDVRPVQPGRARQWFTSRDVVLAVGFSAGAAAIGKLLESYTDSASLALIFLLAVTFAGATGGLVASVLCSVIAFTAYNYLFTEPRYSLSVDNPQDVTTLLVFLAVSFVVGQLAARLRRQAHDAWLSTRRVETLFDFSRRLATAVDDRDLLAAAATGLSELLGKRCVVLRANAQHRADPPAELERAGEFRDTDQAAADWAIGHRETAGRGTGTLPAAAWYFVPIEQSGEVFGVIGVHLPATTDGVDAEQNRLLFTLQTQLAAACERFRLREAAQSAQIQKAAESLRAALLASVSHDLRTPLVSITGALTALRELSHRIPEEDRDRLLGSAIGEAQRLNRLIQNLLDMTRLSHGALALRASAVDVRDAVSQAISQLDGVLAGHDVDVRIPATLPPVHADATLLGQVLENLLENAGKFAPLGTTVRVDARATTEAIYVTVADRGPGIPAAERDKVFDLFYRAGQRDNGTAGAGMGLAISKGFVEAMGGTIGIADSAEGTTVEIQLPRAPSVIPA
jgi:two-component system sensor histidine kinase KdpD